MGSGEQQLIFPHECFHYVGYLRIGRNKSFSRICIGCLLTSAIFHLLKSRQKMKVKQLVLLLWKNLMVHIGSPVTSLVTVSLTVGVAVLLVFFATDYQMSPVKVVSQSNIYIIYIIYIISKIRYINKQTDRHTDTHTHHYRHV